MSKIVKSQMETMLLSLFNAIANDMEEKNTELINSLFEQFDKNERLYEHEIIMANLNLTDFAAKPWFAKNEVKDEKNRYIINYIYNGLFVHYIRKVIERNEGSSCSGDKVNFIVRQVKKAIIAGENQSLFATYEGCDRIPENEWNERAYWSPVSFKDTDEVISAFWKWYNVEKGN